MSGNKLVTMNQIVQDINDAIPGIAKEAGVTPEELFADFRRFLYGTPAAPAAPRSTIKATKD